MHLELTNLDPQHRVEENIALCVGIGSASKVAAERQMAPAARLNVLSVAW